MNNTFCCTCAAPVEVTNEVCWCCGDNPHAAILTFAKKKPTINILVGISGSGKSTWARKHLAHTCIVCPDDIRTELTGDVSDQSQNAEVFKIAFEVIKEAHANGHDVTLDATNVDIFFLKKTLLQIDYFEQKKFIVFNTPFLIAYWRVLKRRNGAKVPFPVLLKMIFSKREVMKFLKSKKAIYALATS